MDAATRAEAALVLPGMIQELTTPFTSETCAHEGSFVCLLRRIVSKPAADGDLEILQILDAVGSHRTLIDEGHPRRWAWTYDFCPVLDPQDCVADLAADGVIGS